MPLAAHVADRLDHIDRDILALLAQRVRAYEDLVDDGEAPENMLEDPVNVSLVWSETAEELGLDPEMAGRIARGVIAICRKAQG